MKNLEYLDHVPRIPEELYEEIFQALDGEMFGPRISVASDAYRIYPSLPKVSHYVRNTFAEVFDDEIWLDKTKTVVGVQKVNTGPRAIHKDTTRFWAYNYIIQLGGDQVRTIFYDNDKNPIEEFVIEKDRWHFLNTDVYHKVEDNTHDRVAVTGFVRIPSAKQLLRNSEILGRF